MKTPHDDLFQLVFTDPGNAVGELQHLLSPEINRRIDWSTLESLPTHFMDQEFTKRHADAAFTVKLDGRKVVLYLLLEHQSTTDRLMALRLLRYMVRLWDEFLKEHAKAQRDAKRRRRPGAIRLPAIIPLVVHHSKTGWKAPMQFQELLDLTPDTLALLQPLLPRFEYLLDDLSAVRSEELKARVMSALGRLTLLGLSQAGKQVDLLPKLVAWRELLLEASWAPNGVAALSAWVRYILHTSETRPKETRELFRELGPKLEEAFMTGAQILTQEARAEGKAEGKAEIVIRLLTLKFGPLLPEQIALVRASSSDDLERYAERVITVDALDRVFAP